jgi:tetratricopeptide (TPR) repeat protein
MLLALLWLLVGAAYVWGGWQQKERLNLSATAGGQYPYLTYAKRIADTGLTESYGDRNRMPLYPLLLSLVSEEDWDTFVERSAWFAIASSVAVLVGIGFIAYWTLPIWSATALTLAAALCVFIHHASFVQAELIYYGVLFASWLVFCRVLDRPNARWAAVGGIAAGLAYLTKASALVIVVAFVVPICIKAVAPWRLPSHPLLIDAAAHARRRRLSALLGAAVACLTFLAVLYPYISNNKARFGRYFYNVNSTFFIWCDSWSQAKSFADEHHISERYPDALPEEIPGPLNYFRTHTWGHMGKRMVYGVKTLCSLAMHEPCFKYFVAALVFCAVLGIKERWRVKKLLGEHWAVAVFCALFFGGYLTVFAWYALVAYGARFLLSLFLPAMFALLWLVEQLAHVSRPVAILGYRVRKSDVLAVGLVIFLMGEGVVTVATTLYEPSKSFVQFYYNESRELLAAGNLDEAEKGIMGVLLLDPEFAPAHHELGIIALQTNRVDGAIASLSIAKHLDPQVADTRNSLGSALVQAGRTEEAIAEFQQATQLDPSFTSAWYNLGGTYCLIGAFDEARHVHQQLDTLDPKLAQKLAALITE